MQLYFRKGVIDMANVKNAFKRYEKKFLLTESQMNELLPLIREHMDPDPYCRNGETYTICNVYFDTEDSAIIRHSLSKPFYKEKLRMRSYGTPEDENSIVFLELKKKIRGEVTKRRAVLTYGQAQRFLRDRTVPADLDYINRQVLAEISWFLMQYKVRPMAYISYDRTAFFDKEDPEFRLTFDENLRTRRKDVDLMKGNSGELLRPQDFRLMEVKVSGAFPLWFADRLCEMGLYTATFSKYGAEYQKWKTDALLSNIIYLPGREYETAGNRSDSPKFTFNTYPEAQNA